MLAHQVGGISDCMGRSVGIYVFVADDLLYFAGFDCLIDFA